MGRYLGVTAVEEKGEKVDWQYTRPQPHIPLGYRLIAVMDNGVYRIAPDVTDPYEFRSFLESYSQGAWLSMMLYLLSEELVPECPDEGRAPTTYRKGV